MSAATCAVVYSSLHHRLPARAAGRGKARQFVVTQLKLNHCATVVQEDRIRRERQLRALPAMR